MAEITGVRGSGAWTNGEPVPDPSKKLIVFCQCRDAEHQFSFEFEDGPAEEDWPRELYFQTYLAKKPFWERLKIAWRYLLGYQSKTGPFAETLLGEQEAIALHQFLSEYLTLVEEDKVT